MKVERSNFILVPNSALSTNVFLQSKCNMHGRYDHASWSWCSCITLLEQSSETRTAHYARFWPHRWTFAKNRTAHAQTHYRKSTQWQWASFVSASVWYRKFSCAQCHTGIQPAVSLWYNSSRTRIYRIIPPLHLISNSLVQLLTWLKVLECRNFGPLKDDSLSINILASNKCFSHRNVFQNAVSSLSKTVIKKLGFSFHVVWAIRFYSNCTSIWYKHF